MIADAILILLYWIIYVITFPLAVTPDVSLPSEIAVALAGINPAFGSIAYAIPLTCAAIMSAFTVFLIFEFVALFLFKGIMWLVKKIPGIN